MGHLIRKDFRLLRSPLVLLVAAGLGFMMSLIPQPVIYVGPLMGLYLGLSVDWAEVGENRAVFVNSLPVERKKVVQTKYVEGLILAVVGNATALLLKFVANMVIDSTSFSYTYIDFFVGVGITLLILAFYFPFQTAFGPTAIFVMFTAAIMLLNPFIYYLGKISYSRVVIMVFIFALAYVCSYFPALRIYRKKDF
ncbi:MAG TPA: ABC-2 transporter permease [Bacillales bacterium]